MSEIKWIKITTTMFEDEKIDFIESLPESDSILIIWIKLLTLAGKCNMNGHIFLTANIPYTDEMLAHKFRRPLNTVRLALQTLKRLGMIEVDENSLILISNWEKHQNVEGMERVREQTRQRVAKHRDHAKLLSSNVSCNVTETHGNALDIDKELDKERDIEKEKTIVSSAEPNVVVEGIPFDQIVDYLNKKTNSNFKHTAQYARKHIRARWNEGHRLEAFMTVIDNKTEDWLNNPKMVKFLRPETIFGTKFEGYLNEKRGIGSGVTNQPQGTGRIGGGPYPSSTETERIGYYDQFDLGEDLSVPQMQGQRMGRE